jgi:hypothetical protein
VERCEATVSILSKGNHDNFDTNVGLQ